MTRDVSRRGGRERSIRVGLPPFQRFLDSHREDVYRFLMAAVGPHELEDCFQETFLSALRAYPRLRDGSNLRGWVLTIAHRKAMDSHRSRSRRPVPVPAVPERAAPGAPGSDPPLWEAVRALPEKQRGAILHRYVSDLPYADVGRILGCTEEAARQNAREGLKKLRRELAR